MGQSTSKVPPSSPPNEPKFVQNTPISSPGFGRAQTMLDVSQLAAAAATLDAPTLQRSSSDTALNTSMTTTTVTQTACQKSYQQALEWGRNEQFLKLAHTFHTNNY
ncbi:uncharacterized protein CELE_Y39B6A.42 [Caenorhabditis elegans]|uniref:Uncharacterized protein n=1 Tax=Caenorhabditis elegans TaxID=6239 RepID=Q8MYM4_CAEEL|nr:Uncharacterized protein CELE_Y39B6A.42 [Caenorhabditis elegans]CAD31832.1 Uncharacterized protein CELE_Y39B6A.42 [Caenorhabditis elegans]|eukprot:NP_507695.2 Uncharacterized protein CELE_Y39B6A.42 [Caenorhabditis elegans]